MRFFLVLLTSFAICAQETQVDLDNVISAEATASSQSSARQENINKLDEEFITLKADIQFLSQELTQHGFEIGCLGCGGLRLSHI